MYSQGINKGKIIDFDFAVSPGEDTGKTHMYAAPELADGMTLASYPNDIYAFGLICIELLQSSPNIPKIPNNATIKESEYEFAMPVFDSKMAAFNNSNNNPNMFIKADAVISFPQPLFEYSVDPSGYNFYINLVNFLKKMVDPNPINRPTAREVQEFFEYFRSKYALIAAKDKSLVTPSDKFKEQKAQQERALREQQERASKEQQGREQTEQEKPTERLARINIAIVFLYNRDFTQHMKAFETKAGDLNEKAKKDPDYKASATKAKELCTALRKAQNKFISGEKKSEEAEKEFKNACLDAINDAKPVLEQHRGWKGVVDLLATISFGITIKLGLFALKTDSAKILNRVKQCIQVR